MVLRVYPKTSMINRTSPLVLFGDQKKKKKDKI